MAYKRIISLITGVMISLMVASQVIAQDVEFIDGTFDMSNWEAHVYHADDGAEMVATTTQNNGGNPGANLEMTFRWNEGIAGARGVFVFFKNKNATYNPSVQGAIASIDVSEDGRVVSDTHGAASITLPMRLALEQDGNIYSNMIDTAVVQNEPWPANWVTVTETGQVAANFPIRSGTGPARPDFSETGSEIHFGFVRANSTTVRVREITTAIDNWRVTIHPEADPPVPGTADLAIVKTADILEVNPGVPGSDRTTFTLTVTNHGPEAINAVATDQLPAEMLIAAGQSPVASLGSYDVDSGEWAIGSLASGQVETLTIPVQVVAGTTGCVTNSASVASAPGETIIEIVSGNNSDEVAVAAPPGCADLSISGRADDWNFFAPIIGDCMDIFFEIGVTNQGPGTASNVKIKQNEHASSPFFVAYISGPGGLYDDEVWEAFSMFEDCDDTDHFYNPVLEKTEVDLGTLAPGETRWVEVMRMNSVDIYGDDFSVTIDYNVESASIDPEPSDNTTVYSQTVVRIGGDNDDDDGGGSGGCFISTVTCETASAP